MDMTINQKINAKSWYAGTILMFDRLVEITQDGTKIYVAERMRIDIPATGDWLRLRTDRPRMAHEYYQPTQIFIR